MKCPHCLTAFHDTPENRTLDRTVGTEADQLWGVQYSLCPECHKMIIFLLRGPCAEPTRVGERPHFSGIPEEILVYPKGSNRPPAPPQVPKPLVEDYTEACLVLPDSPKASAALSRRCLQALLTDKFQATSQNLAKQIKSVIDSGELPLYLANNIDYIRNVGNFAAHPMKAERTGEIVPVEPGEAEWCLDVLESLFDFCFVQPNAIKKKREALDKKLKGAGKKPMK